MTLYSICPMSSRLRRRSS